MIKATISDKPIVSAILAEAFDQNNSVNYIVKQDENRRQRIRWLMDYSFDACYASGEVFLSNNKEACALILYPDRQKFSLSNVMADLKFILRVSSITRLRKLLNREKKIKALQPKGKLCYIWFIGVAPGLQGNGIGSSLLSGILDHCSSSDRTICLETSVTSNISWYKKHGFYIYNTLYLGYHLYFLKR
ncbi:MAG: GNAT family N-acetyltransferase [Ferruginibacter sp.]